MKTGLLLITTAIIEFSTGIALMLFPARTTELLLNSAMDTQSGIIVCRVAGAAIIAISVMCWMSRKDKGSIAGTGLLTGMLLYNIIVGGVLIYAGFDLQFSVILLIAIIVHLALTVWCVLGLRYDSGIKYEY